jgi:hypothetical protein
VKFAYISLLLIWLIGAVCAGCIATTDETRGIQKAQAETSLGKVLTINEIRTRLDHYLGKEITINAFYGDPRRESIGIPFTRSDWIIYDETNAVFVSGKRPPAGIEQYSRRDWGTPIEVQGVVMQTDKGVPYIFITEVKIRK